MNGSRPQDGAKSSDIPKRMVREAYQRVKANKGAPGVDGVTTGQSGQDLKGNLYKLWNRMSSGSYFPPAARGVQIPKAGGQGVRLPGVPAVAGRVAQTVAAMALEARTEPVFHEDSYGCRPRRGALDAVANVNTAWPCRLLIPVTVRMILPDDETGVMHARRCVMKFPALISANMPMTFTA